MLATVQGACANKCWKTDSTHAHSQSPYQTQLNAYFDFCSHLSERCVSLLRSASSSVGPSNSWQGQAWSFVTALCRLLWKEEWGKKTGGKYKVIVWLFTLFDGVMTNSFTHSPAATPSLSLFPSFYRFLSLLHDRICSSMQLKNNAL